MCTYTYTCMHVYIYIYAQIVNMVPVSVKNTPTEERTLADISLKSAISGAGERINCSWYFMFAFINLYIYIYIYTYIYVYIIPTLD